jgi:ribokinase
VSDDGANQIVVSPGANACVSAQQVEQALRTVAPCVVLAQLEIPIEAVESASLARKFILNPAPAAAVSDDLIARCFAITPNEQEIEALTGVAPEDEASCAKAADLLLAKGVKHVLITLGERGCFWKSGEDQEQFPPPHVCAVDTTGAGDAFNGAFALGVAEGRGIREAIQFANQVAALSTTRHGAQASMPTREELEKANASTGGPAEARTT